MQIIQFKKLDPRAVIPAYQTEKASGFDFVAIEETRIPVGQTRLVKTGLACAIPQGTELQVRARSGLALKSPGYLIKNGVGTVDEDYRGELCMIVHNLAVPDGKELVIAPGERVAQGVICPVIRCAIQEASELDETERGAGGYGSTGGFGQ